MRLFRNKRPFKGGRGEGKVEARKKTTKPHKSCKGNCSPPPTNVHMPIQLLSNGCLQQLPPLLPPLPAVLQARCSAARKIPLVSRVSGPACVPSQPLVGVYSPRGSKSVQQSWSWCCASTAQKCGSTSVPFQNCFGHKSETQHNRLL